MKPTVIYEFLPDGTFNATPPGSTTVVDKTSTRSSTKVARSNSGPSSLKAKRL